MNGRAQRLRPAAAPPRGRRARVGAADRPRPPPGRAAALPHRRAGLRRRRGRAAGAGRAWTTTPSGSLGAQLRGVAAPVAERAARAARARRRRPAAGRRRGPSSATPTRTAPTPCAALRTAAELALHPAEAARHGLADRARARLRSPHGEAVVAVRLDDACPEGVAYVAVGVARLGRRPAPGPRPRPRPRRDRADAPDGRDLPRRPDQGRGGGVRAHHGLRVHAAVGAQADRPLPGPLRAQPHRPGGLHAAARRRGEADLQGGLRPPGGQQAPLPARPDDLGGRGRGGGGRDPLRRLDRPLRPRRRAGRRRPGHRGAVPVRALGPRLLRPDPRRLGQRQQVQPAGRRPHGRAARVVRGRDGPVGGRRRDDGPEPLAGGHRERPGRHGLVHRPAAGGAS